MTIVGLWARLGLPARDFGDFEAFADEFEAKIEFARELKNHKTSLESSDIMSVAVGVGVLVLDVDIGFEELDAMILGDDEVVAMVNVTSSKHTGGAE